VSLDEKVTLNFGSNADSDFVSVSRPRIRTGLALEEVCAVLVFLFESVIDSTYTAVFFIKKFREVNFKSSG